MSDENTQIKDLTEMERLILGASVNFVLNILNNQIYHIENHDPQLAELLISNQEAQEDYILIQNCISITKELKEILGNTFINLPVDQLESLSKPGLKLEKFFFEIFSALVCGDIDEEEEQW